MLKDLWNWFAGPNAEARRLTRDTEFILDALMREHYGPIRADVAADLRKDIDYVRETFLNKDDAFGEKRAGDHLKRSHGEARRRRDQRALTSLTLAIIYFKAERLGEQGQPVVAAIDGYLAEWSHPASEGGALPPTGD